MKKNNEQRIYSDAQSYIIDALATYICIVAVKQDIFTKEVDCTNIAKCYHATIEEVTAAYHHAKIMLILFLDEQR